MLTRSLHVLVVPSRGGRVLLLGKLCTHGLPLHQTRYNSRTPASRVCGLGGGGGYARTAMTEEYKSTVERAVFCDV